MKDCGIVKDLLPLVAEDMASEESTAFVKEHIERCADCKAALDAMQAPVEAEPAAPLKTVRKAVKRRGWLIAGLIACLVAALIFGVFARLTKPIVIHSAEEAFTDVAVEAPAIPIVAAEDGTIPRELNEQLYIIVQPGSDSSESGQADPYQDIQLFVLYQKNSDGTMEPVNGADLTDGEISISDPINRILKLTVRPGVTLLAERTGAEISFYAYTTQWVKMVPQTGKENETIEVTLSGVDAVFFEPYDNTDHEILYQREGYPVEAGFALPRLVLNYYFLMALAGTAILALVWFVLRLCKKEKGARVLGVLLILAGSFVIAFLAAGFPATTIAPARELAFVLVIALLLIGAGLCGRKLLKKE